MAYLDPENTGLTGKTYFSGYGENTLDGEADKRLLKLESTLRSFGEELDRWPKNPDVEELRGQFDESYHFLGERRGQRY